MKIFFLILSQMKIKETHLPTYITKAGGRSLDSNISKDISTSRISNWVTEYISNYNNHFAMVAS